MILNMKNYLSSLLANTRDRRKHGFTLIELLIVIGILGILVVAVLLTLNPAEAQRKTRDAKRMKDLSTMVSVLQQYLDGGGAPPAAATTWTSAGGLTACDGTGWLGLNVCTYLSALPLDPNNNQSRTCTGAGASPGCNNGAAPQPMIYRVRMDTGGQYEIDVRQESNANNKNVANDGGDATSWAEAGSSLTLIAGN